MKTLVKRIAVLDRTKESGAAGEPLYKDVTAALLENGLTNIKVVGGRYGLGGKEFTPNMVKAVFDNLNNEMKNDFTVGEYVYIENVKQAIESGAKEFKAKILGEKPRQITLKMDALTDAEKQIILKGCLINYYKG